MLYILDQLAQRWSTDPERLDEIDAETVLRGLSLMKLEASVTSGKG